MRRTGVTGRDWNKMGITESGHAIADSFVTTAIEWLKLIRGSAPAGRDFTRDVDDLAFIAKQAVWQAAEETGMIGKKKPKARKRTVRR